MSARDDIRLAEACLQELLRQEAAAQAPFKAGDCITVTYDGKPVVVLGPYLVVEVECGRRRGSYIYRVLAITKAGRTTRRNWTYVFPSARADIAQAEVRLNAEGQEEAAYWRDVGQTLRERVVERGDLGVFEPITGLLNTVTYRTRARLA